MASRLGQGLGLARGARCARWASASSQGQSRQGQGRQGRQQGRQGRQAGPCELSRAFALVNRAAPGCCLPGMATCGAPCGTARGRGCASCPCLPVP